MKTKERLIISIIVFIMSTILLISNSYASEDITQKLYQDVTINTDGSITIKEAALLGGNYNGRSREIKYQNIDSVTFTGIYSNFAGNVDIYNGKGVSDVKVYDIS